MRLSYTADASELCSTLNIIEVNRYIENGSNRAEKLT